MNLALPTQKVTLSLKYFDEFSNRWTHQGYSLQISVGAVFKMGYERDWPSKQDYKQLVSAR
jgi:hypothetical protein